MTFADANSPIIILPGKFVLSQFLLIYPKRRFSLYKLSNFADALLSAEGNQAMSMITPAVNTIEPYVFFARIFFHMLKYFFSQIGRIQEMDSVFCAEYHMDVNSDPAHNN